MNPRQKQYVFGFHAVQKVFEQDVAGIIELWIQQDRQETHLQTLLQQAQQHHIALHVVPKKTLDKLTQNGLHQGIVIRYKNVSFHRAIHLEDLLAALTVPPFLLVLDEVQDPHNLGACLRTAEAAGVHAVIVPKNQACPLTATVRKVACGAAEMVPLIYVTNLARTLQELQEQGIWLVGAVANQNSNRLFEMNLTGALALVLGAEGSGLRRLTQESCDQLAHIPLLGQIESLNVSVAVGICLYEAVRQRLFSSSPTNSSVSDLIIKK